MNVSSDKKVHVLRVAQLQSYWRKLCEDEKRSQRRNEQLLRDLNRIDEHAARLAEKTEKLRMLKCEYEAYIERTYPNWKEKIMSRQQQQRIYNEPRWNGLIQPFVEGSGLIQQPVHDGIVQQYPRTNGFIQQMPGSDGPTHPYPGPNESVHPYPGSNGPAYSYPRPSGPTLSYPLYPGPNEPAHPYSGPNGPAHPTPGVNGPANPYLGANGSVHPHSGPYGPARPHPGQNGPAQQYPEAKELIQLQRPTEFPQQPKSGVLQQNSKRNGTEGEDSYKNTHSVPYAEEPLVTSDGSLYYFTPIRAYVMDGQNPDRNLQPGSSESMQRRTDEHRTSAGDSHTKVSVESPAKGHVSKDPFSSLDSASKDPDVSPTKNLTSKDPISVPARSHASKDPAAGPAKGPSSSNPVPTKHLVSDSWVDGPLKQPDSNPISSPGKGNVKEPLTTKEVNKIMASPGKKADGMNRAEPKEEIQTDRTYASEISDYEEDTDRNDNLSNCNDAVRMRHQGKSFSVPRPDVNLQGFCRMLKAVEDEVSLGRSPKLYYRSATPRPSVIQEIITNANRGSPLSHFNADSIAMVIVEQLPCLSMNSKHSCVLTDRILTSFFGEVNNKIVREQLDPSDHMLWESLYDHFLVFLQYKVLSVTEIADIFAPLLVAGNSKLQKQAIVLVTKVLEAVSEEELNMATPRSTSDFSLGSCHPPTDSNVIQAALQSVKSSTNTFDQKRKETAAYKQLLASTSMSNKPPDMESDEDDEIEKNLSQHFPDSRPPAVNKTSEENIKSPKSPDNLKSPKSPKSDSARSNFSDDSLKQEIDRKNSLVLKSASLKSGRSAVESIISRVHEDFDLDDDDPPIPTSNLANSKDFKVKERKDVEDDDDFWA